MDNQTSIIGTNSVTINTANNTNVKGAVIANIINANSDSINGGNGLAGYNINSDTLQGAIDGGNLNLNTKSLTFSNLEDHFYNSNTGYGISTSIGAGINSNNSINPIQNLSFYPNGQTTLTLQNSSNKKEQRTFATIGQGNITTGTDLALTFDANGNLTSQTGGTVNDSNITANLNRDVTQSQIITKDVITGALDVNVTVDNRLFTESGRNQIGNELARLPDNLVIEAKFMANAPKEIYNEVNEAVINVYDKLNPAADATPEVRKNLRAIIRTAAITGDVETLKEQIKALTNKTPTDNDLEAITNLSNNRDFAELREEVGIISYDRFLDKYTLSTGIFFDGTGNDVNSTNSEYSEATNVARMSNLYVSKDDPKYISGIGTSGGLDTVCLAFGCGADDKQTQALKFLSGVVNNDKNNEYLFFPIDVTSFSRGATTGADFINNINNETYWNEGLLTRSHLMFDPVGSYGLAGNGIDFGKDFSTPTNIIAIQINAKDEQRNLFDLQSLSSKNGILAGKHWTEITLPGVHSDIGGGNKVDEQGKSQGITFYSMQAMISEAAKYGIDFKEIPQNQLPSFELSTAMNLYRTAQSNYSNNPTEGNKFYLEDVNKFIQNKFAHDSTFGGSGKIYNYSIGDDRGIFYPNDKYLTESEILKMEN